MSDAQNTTRMSRPSSRTELGRRISAVCDLFESRKKAANISGRSTDMLWKYEKGTSEPPFSPLADLCLAAGVRMEWLATGEGPMRHGDSPKPAPPLPSQYVREPDAAMDMGLLATAARITDEVFRKYHVRDRVDAEGFAELVHVVYQDLAHGRAEDAASEALDRILAITRTPP